MLLKDLKNLIPDILRAKEKARTKKKLFEEPNNTTEEQVLTPLQKALLENNKLLEDSISLAVSKAVITEMDFLLQAKERQEEERYKKLDNLIRQQQVLRKESARSTPLRNFRRIFEA